MKKIALLAAVAVLASPGVAAAASTGDLSSMLSRVINDLADKDQAFLTLFWAFCRCAGLVLVIKGIAHLVKREGVPGSLTTILIGALLIALPDTLGMINQTIFKSEANNSLLSSAAKEGTLNATTVVFVNFSIMMIQIVGFLALYRGIKTFADVALSGQRHQPEQTRAAWIFIVSGVLCINIVLTLGVIAATLGGEANVLYGKIFGA